MHTKFLFENLNPKHPLEDLVAGGDLILNGS
jgi:hypothetical protein